jgi:DNA repair protein SbcC/Rad50
MMLKKIEKLIIRDVRKWKGEHTFDFEDGINLIKGPNGSGKSTIWLCIALGLTHSAKSKKLKEQLSPNTGGLPIITVNFQTNDGKRYSITKVFGEQTASTLRDMANDEIIALGSEADEQVRILTFSMAPTNGTYRTKGGPMNNVSSTLSDSIGALSFPPQGQLDELPEIVEAIRRIGLEVDEAELSKALDKISLNSETESKSFISAKRQDGSPKSNATGKIVAEKNNLKQLKESLESSESKAKDLKRAEEELQNLQQTHVEVSEEDKATKREEINNLRKEAKVHREDRETAKSNLDSAKAKLDPRQSELTKRIDLEEKVNRKITDIETKENKLLEAKQSFDQAKQLHDKNQETNEQIKTEQQLIQSWKDYENSDGQRSTNQALLDDLNETIKSRKTLENEIAVIEKSIEDIKLPTKSEFKELRELEKREFALKAKQTMKVQLTSDIGDLKIKVDGTDKDDDCEAFHTVDIYQNSTKIIAISQEFNDAELTEIELKRNEILNPLQADNMAVLHQRQTKQSNLEGSLETKQELLTKMKTNEQVTEIIHDLENSLANITPKPKGKKPGDNLEELSVRVDERLKFSEEKIVNSNKQIQNKNELVISIDSVLKVSKQDLAKLESELANHITEFGATNELQDHVIKMKIEFDNLHKIHKDLQANKKLIEDTKEDRANKLQTKLDTQVDLWGNINTLEERVKLLREDETLANLPDLRVKVKMSEDSLKSLQLDHDAYEIISVVASELMHDAQNKSRHTVNEEVQRLVSYVLANPDLKVKLDDDGMPSQIGRVPFRDESHGGREQISMIWRLVLLHEETNGDGTVLALDDPLTNTDDIRMKRMKEVLTSYSNNNVQILLFSCHGEDYEDLADQIIDVSPSSLD